MYLFTVCNSFVSRGARRVFLSFSFLKCFSLIESLQINKAGQDMSAETEVCRGASHVG